MDGFRTYRVRRLPFGEIIFETTEEDPLNNSSTWIENEEFTRMLKTEQPGSLFWLICGMDLFKSEPAREIYPTDEERRNDDEEDERENHDEPGIPPAPFQQTEPTAAVDTSPNKRVAEMPSPPPPSSSGDPIQSGLLQHTVEGLGLETEYMNEGRSIYFCLPKDDQTGATIHFHLTCEGNVELKMLNLLGMVSIQLKSNKWSDAIMLCNAFQRDTGIGQTFLDFDENGSEAPLKYQAKLPLTKGVDEELLTNFLTPNIIAAQRFFSLAHTTYHLY